MKRIFTTGALLFLFSQPSWAMANDWHWNTNGTDSYTGQIQLKDDLGSNMSFQRYGLGSSPFLSGTTSVQSPLVVVAGGKDFDVGLFRTGVEIPYKVCKGNEVWKVYVTPATACNTGLGTNIGGFHGWATKTATGWTPRLSVYVSGAGWRDVNNHACGVVQAMQVCEKTP